MSHPCHLNNSAVEFIEARQYDLAITTLTKALHVVKAAMSGSTSTHNNSQCDALACDFLTSAATPSFVRMEDKEGNIGRIYNIFCAPLVFHLKLLQEEEENCELLSHVLIYNLALTYHLQGMEDETVHGRRVNLEKARSLYLYAHRILAVEKPPLVPILHGMAIASNLGQIHHVLGEEECATRCFENLLSTILYIVDCGQGDKLDQFDGFFGNIMPLICRSAFAPAA